MVNTNDVLKWLLYSFCIFFLNMLNIGANMFFLHANKNIIFTYLKTFEAFSGYDTEAIAQKNIDDILLFSEFLWGQGQKQMVQRNT